MDTTLGSHEPHLMSDGVHLRCPDPKALRDRAEAEGIKHKYQDLNGIKHAIWTAEAAEHSCGQDDNGVTAVFLHGLTHSTQTVFHIVPDGYQPDDYSLLLKMARRGITAVGLDQCGYGLSEARPRASTFLELSDDVAALLGALRAEQPSRKLVLVGWSWGSQIASFLIGQRPSVADGWVYWSGNWGGGRNGWPPHLTRHAKKLEATGVYEKPRRINDNAAITKNFEHCLDLFDPKLLEHYSHHAHWLDPSSPNDGLIAARAEVPLHNPDLVTIPTLGIIGAREDGRRADFEDFMAHLKNAPWVKYDRIFDSDHYIQYGPQRSAFADLLTDRMIEMVGSKDA